MELKRLKRIAKVMLSLLLVISMFPALHSVEAAEKWTEHKKQANIKTDREWKVNFSATATKAKIKKVSVESNGEDIPVNVTYDQSETIRVKPVHRYLSGQDHTLKIELANGKRDRMNFTTGVESFGNNQRIYTDEVVKGNATSAKHFYSIRPTKDGELTLKGSTKNKKMTIYLYDNEKEKGEFIGFTKEEENPTLSRELQRNKIYYVAIEATGAYELETSLQAKSVTAESSLTNAQQAIDALPVPADVMPKHEYAIGQAKTLIALARLFEADATKIEQMEARIEKLEDVVKPLAIEAVDVVNASTFEIQFNRAVNPELMTLRLGNETIDRKYITFNANRTFATIAMPENLPSGTRMLSVLLPSVEPLTKQLVISEEEVATIDILGDTAVRIAGNQVSIGYRALNQYGEEMANPALTARATGGITAESPSITFEKGRVLIPIGSTPLEGGTTFTLKLSKGKVVAEKEIKVSDQSSVYDVKIKEMNPKNKVIKETTDLADAAEATYLIVEAKDQFGAPIKDVNELAEAMTITSTNPNVVGVATTFEKHKEDEGLYKLKLTNPVGDRLPTVGKTTIVLTTLASNNKSEFSITVEEGARVDTFELGVPEHVTAGSNLLIDIHAVDKDEQAINDLDIIKGSVSGIQWTTKPSIQPEVKKVDKDGKEIDKEEKGRVVLFFKGEDVKQGTLEITGVTSTNKKVTETITVKEQAKPATWTTELSSTNVFEKIEEDSDKWNEEKYVVNKNEIKVKDQYGNEMAALPEGYSLRGKTNDRAVIVTNQEDNVTIGRSAVGTATVTISLYKGNQEIQGSEKVFTFVTKDGSGYFGYQIEPVGTIYDTEAAGTTNHEDYNRELIVLGIVNDKGAMVRLDNDDFKLTKESTAGIELVDGNLLIKEKFYYSGMTTKLDLVIEIKSTGETFTEEVTLSKERPKVTEFIVENDRLAYTLSTEEEGNKEVLVIDWSWLVGEAAFSAVDQYGVKSVKPEEPEQLSQLEFPDGTVVKPTITFTTKKGSQLFEGNGTHNAAITNFSKGSEVDATIRSNGQAVTVTITMDKDHMPEVDDVVKDLNEKLKEKQELTKGTTNLLDVVRSSVTNSNYDISIDSVDNNISYSGTIIGKDGRIYPVECDKNCDDTFEEVKVTFTISHKTATALKDETAEITFKVPKATEVMLADGSLGKAGDRTITDLKADKEYIVFVDGKYHSVVQDGEEPSRFILSSKGYTTKAEAEKESEPLVGTSIQQLTNGKTYKIEEVAPKEVLLDKGSVAGAEKGDKKITGLEEHHRYVVSYAPNGTDKKYFGVLANGKLHTQARENKTDASQDAGFLDETEITSLINGVTYKVEKANPFKVVGLKAKLVDNGLSVQLDFPRLYTDKVQIDYRIAGENWKPIEEGNLLGNTIGSTSATIINSTWTPGKFYQFKLSIDDDRYETESNTVELTIPKLNITERAITVGQPVYNGTKPSVQVSGNQYTIESESWTPAGANFGAEIPVLTIKFKPDNEYTLDGLSSNSFTVTNASKTVYTREGELGVITATFPEIKAPEPPSEGDEG